MRYSRIFPKTKREAPKDAMSCNHQLLVRAGFIDQLMSGSWTLLPMGWKVVEKISNIIREELGKIGCQEVLMPLLHPKEIWNETGRWDSAKEVMYQLKDTRDKDFALSFTHEEIVMDLLRKHVSSYRDLPVAIYHFSTKFRNEARPTGGILRGREFLMKDLYSVHESETDLFRFYEEVKQAYLRIFGRIGLDAKVVEASGGVFTDNLTHEFQVLSEVGEDTIYACDKCDWAMNKEIYDGQKECPKCGGKIVESKSIEVGNIFPFGQKKYASEMNVKFLDAQGESQKVYFGSYGIGTTRAMGTIVELHNDDKGIIWPSSVSPFDVHLVDLNNKGEAAYNLFKESMLEVLWDDTDRRAGEKFADADLIGIPVRLVVSNKVGDGNVEWKERESDSSEIISLSEAIARLV